MYDSSHILAIGGPLSGDGFHALMWGMGGAMLLFGLQRTSHATDVRPVKLLRSALGELGKVCTVAFGVAGTFGLLRVAEHAPGVLGDTAHLLLLGVGYALAAVLGMFLARQFLAPPWWRLNAWNPGGYNHSYNGSIRDMGAWIVADASCVLRDMPTFDRIVVMLGVPALTWDIARVVGAERALWATMAVMLVLYVALAVALVTANRIPRVLMSRLQDLRVVTHRIAGGDLSARVSSTELGDYPELAELIDDVNSMARSLQAREHENTLLHHQLHTNLQHEQERSTRDPLTSLRNHRYFQESLASEIMRCERTGTHVTISILDLDDFKLVNDEFGHQEGDAVLLRLTQALAHNLRPYDLPCRLGGEEFGIIFPETTAVEAKAVLDRLAESLRDCGPRGTPATFSAGVATFPHHAQDQAMLYQLADESSYAAKSKGKARTLIYDPAQVATMGSKQHSDQRAREQLIKTARTLVNTVDSKDSLSRDHSELVGRYSAAIASTLGMDEAFVSNMYLCGLLHDVGKIGLPDSIVTKPGRLTSEEYEHVKHHPELSFQIVHNAGLAEVAVWVRHHHEHFDGSGYPDGLRGDEIPLGSRIVLVAEAFEVMTSDRVYRRALSADQALAELSHGAGTTFDQGIVQAMVHLVQAGGLLSESQPAPEGLLASVPYTPTDPDPHYSEYPLPVADAAMAHDPVLEWHNPNAAVQPQQLSSDDAGADSAWPPRSSWPPQGHVEHPDDSWKPPASLTDPDVGQEAA